MPKPTAPPRRFMEPSGKGHSWGHRGSKVSAKAPKPPMRFPEPVVSPAPLCVPLERVPVGGCHWVVGEAQLYCAQPASGGKGYCAGHHAHVYLAVEPKPLNEAYFVARLGMYGTIGDAMPTAGALVQRPARVISDD